jgi:glycosyltransferase involved in cell wall biosynthesis
MSANEARGVGARLSFGNVACASSGRSSLSAVSTAVVTEDVEHAGLERAARATRAIAGGDGRVTFIGLFPPPVDGQRVITQRMFEAVSAVANVKRHDLDPFPKIPSLSKALSALTACATLIADRIAGCSTLYLAPHSGKGLFYSCGIAWTARLLRYRLYVHYHSYRNIARHSGMMERFVTLCGRDAVHIVLAPPMARELRELYGTANHVVTLSNTAFVTPNFVARDTGQRRRLRIGHLSNLSIEKGIATVVDCLRGLIAQGADVEMVIGGAPTDKKAEEIIRGAAAEFGDRWRYLGQLRGHEVSRFYEEIDVFLFPTAYEHEAEPVVVIEAMSAGVPVIATDRGCIRHLVGEQGGRVFEADAFVERAVAELSAWAGSPERLADVSRQACARFTDLRREATATLHEILVRMSDRVEQRA